MRPGGSPSQRQTEGRQTWPKQRAEGMVVLATGRAPVPDTEYAQTPGGRSSSSKFFLAVNSFVNCSKKLLERRDWSGLEGY